MTAANMEMLTPAEAAVVASVSMRDVHRTIDEKILPEDLYAGSQRMRRLQAAACTFIAFYFQAAEQLTSEERKRTISLASRQLREHFRNLLLEEWIVRDDFLRIDLGPFLVGVRERLAKLARARELVVEDPETLAGTPVIRGTRIPVYDVAASLEKGVPAKRILAAYPSLSPETIELAALYAEANPQRGRPSQSPVPPKGAAIVSTHRVQRHKRTS